VWLLGQVLFTFEIQLQCQGAEMNVPFGVFVAISNARLALLVKDIELTWTNLVAIFAGIPGMVSKIVIILQNF